MAREIGIKKNAPKALKALDEKLDRAKNVKEGSKADLAMDRKLMAKAGKPGPASKRQK